MTTVDRKPTRASTPPPATPPSATAPSFTDTMKDAAVNVAEVVDTSMGRPIGTALDVMDDAWRLGKQLVTDPGALAPDRVASLEERIAGMEEGESVTLDTRGDLNVLQEPIAQAGPSRADSITVGRGANGFEVTSSFATGAFAGVASAGAGEEGSAKAHLLTTVTVKSKAGSAAEARDLVEGSLLAGSRSVFSPLGAKTLLDHASEVKLSSSVDGELAVALGNNGLNKKNDGLAESTLVGELGVSLALRLGEDGRKQLIFESSRKLEGSLEAGAALGTLGAKVGVDGSAEVVERRVVDVPSGFGAADLMDLGRVASMLKHGERETVVKLETPRAQGELTFKDASAAEATAALRAGRTVSAVQVEGEVQTRQIKSGSLEAQGKLGELSGKLTSSRVVKTVKVEDTAGFFAAFGAAHAPLALNHLIGR